MKFGQDTQSGCFISLARENFTDCDQLRNQIAKIQAELIDLDLLIAKGGIHVQKNETGSKIVIDGYSLFILEGARSMSYSAFYQLQHKI